MIMLFINYLMLTNQLTKIKFIHLLRFGFRPIYRISKFCNSDLFLRIDPDYIFGHTDEVRVRVDEFNLNFWGITSMVLHSVSKIGTLAFTWKKSIERSYNSFVAFILCSFSISIRIRCGY